MAPPAALLPSPSSSSPSSPLSPPSACHWPLGWRLRRLPLSLQAARLCCLATVLASVSVASVALGNMSLREGSLLPLLFLPAPVWPAAGLAVCLVLVRLGDRQAD